MEAEAREDRFELVDGVPQRMAGAEKRNDRLALPFAALYARVAFPTGPRLVT